MMALSLPTPRSLLTSLINSLPEIRPIVSSEQESTTSLQATTGSGTLKLLGSAGRNLLITLHVLYPPLVLQALDLLDRGLVTRIIQVIPNSSTNNQEDVVKTIIPPQAHIHLPGPPEQEDERQREADLVPAGNTIYLVRSAQDARSKTGAGSRYNASALGISYTVRLEAWNCSCAAFAFSAFPAATSFGLKSWAVDEGKELEEGKAGVEWEFGGMSNDGKYGGSVPCCKHLLACLLSERCGSFLGGSVKERKVGREEMAGLGAEI